MGYGGENKHLMILAVVRQSAVAQPEWLWGERHGEGSQVDPFQVEVLPHHGTEAWSMGGERAG